MEDFFRAFERGKDPIALVVTKGEPSARVFPEVRGGLAFVAVENETSTEAVLSLLADCARRGRWCRVDLVTSAFDPALYQALRLVAATGHLQFQKAGETVDVPLAAGAKIVCVVSNETLSKITIPTFLGLFGIVYRE